MCHPTERVAGRQAPYRIPPIAENSPNITYGQKWTIHVKKLKAQPKVELQLSVRVKIFAECVAKCPSPMRE